jgi:hypothetical protein
MHERIVFMIPLESLMSMAAPFSISMRTISKLPTRAAWCSAAILQREEEKGAI